MWGGVGAVGSRFDLALLGSGSIPRLSGIGSWVVCHVRVV